MHLFAGATADGGAPYGAVIKKGAVLFGMTPFGGGTDEGTIFKINANGTGFTVLHSFAGGAGDGLLPLGSLTFFGGQFYGTTCRGGTVNVGTIFRISPKGPGFTILHSFANDQTDAYYPHGSLKAMGGKLYGMTCVGGTHDYGAIFRIGTTGAGYVLLHSFTDSVTDGTWPILGTLVAKGTVLYGMTENGGASDNGTIFKINTNGTGFAILHSFAGGAMDGGIPYGSLIFCGSQLYGLTQYGGAGDYGTIFRIGVNGTGFTVLHSFAAPAGEGAYPYGDLLLNGKMVYGMTNYGGSADFGVIFSYKLK